MISANPLVTDTGTPPIPEAKAWLARYGGRAGPPIDLSQAVPGDPPPADLLDALARAAGSAASATYGPILGDAALREAYAAEVASVYGGPVAPSEVAITAGCNLAFVAAAMALAKAGEAILLPAPWYFNHEMTLKMLGIEARPLPCRPERGFVPDPDEAARLIDGRVRAIVLVTPNNPTGAVYPAELIARFSALARSRGVALVLDETYRDFLPAGMARAHDLFVDGAAGREHVVQLYSFSKAYGIPGHRLGAMVAPAALIPQIAKLLDCLQICAPRVAQAGAVHAVAALGAHRAANRAEIAARAEAFRAAFAGRNDWQLLSIGAYFAYLAHPFADRTAATVAERLAVERGVLALPASYFGPGQERFLRVAFANARVETIRAVPARLDGFA